MMSFYCLYLFLFISFPSGQTQIIYDTWPTHFIADQARLNISNRNYNETIFIEYNLDVCHNCTYDRVNESFPIGFNDSFLLSTIYLYDFQFVGNSTGNRTACGISSYKFHQGGTYLLEIFERNFNNQYCQIRELQGPQSDIHYWSPIIVSFAIILLVVIITQIWHCLTQNPRFFRTLPTAVQQNLTIHDGTISPPRTSNLIANDPNDDIISTLTTGPDLSLAGSRTRLRSNSTNKIIPKRLRSLDTFRGLSLMIMVLVNYGGGGYWFLKHSVWHGLTIADLVFPWFTWMMGISIVLSQRSLRAKNVRKTTIFLKICRRTFTLFVLGLILQSGWDRFVNIRMLGVLQRLAACYFFAAIIVLIFDDTEDEPVAVEWQTDSDVHQPLRTELKRTVLDFWPQWIFILLMTLTWILITFIPTFEGCPRGYLGPGGKDQQGAYENCTGGIAGYIDRKILQTSHMYQSPTCKRIYETHIPFEPEGLLGILTGTLLCYLGVQAGHSFAYSTSTTRVCGHWLISGLISGGIGLGLSWGGRSDSWIPINKNLWSLSFVLVLAGLAFIILTLFYLLVDVSKRFTGEPFVWLGMNSIVVYVGHEVCAKSFPIQFQVEFATHAQLLGMHLYGVLIWTIIAGLMYRKKFFIAL